MLYLRKLFGQNHPFEEQREIQLITLQLNKLIKRTIDNIDDAISLFDKSEKNFKEEGNELVKIVFSTVDESSAMFTVKENESLLQEIEEIIKRQKVGAFLIIMDRLKVAKKKNYDAYIAILAKGNVDNTSGGGKDAPEMFLVRQILLSRNVKDKLDTARISLLDLEELFSKQFSVYSFEYVNKKRVDEIRTLQSDEFDLIKLICLCEELNSNFQNHNYLSVAMLVRAILDHVPPIFGFKTFIEVASNYGGKSLKKSLQNLQNSSRNISDAYLHETIKRKESLPNETQIDFRNDLDVLLSEVVRILK